MAETNLKIIAKEIVVIGEIIAARSLVLAVRVTMEIMVVHGSRTVETMNCTRGNGSSRTFIILYRNCVLFS